MVHTVHFTIIAEWKVLDAKCAVRLLIKVQCHIFLIFFKFKFEYITIYNINRERHKPKIQEK